jgi:hypothetical protein
MNHVKIKDHKCYKSKFSLWRKSGKNNLCCISKIANNSRGHIDNHNSSLFENKEPQGMKKIHKKDRDNLVHKIQ